jgi:type IV/VI secretion system ImpK/VasF family protein
MSNEDGSGPNRTVFRPSPLQQLREGQSKGPAAGPPAGESLAKRGPSSGGAAHDDIPEPPVRSTPRNVLMARAAPLLALLAAMRSGRATMDLPDLHGQASAVISAIQSDLRVVVDEETLRRATYALAATADDVALNLPDRQADTAEWARRSLVVRFFQEAIGGDRFWRLLDEMIARPSENADLLELYHACMAAGFEGRYRVFADGKSAHQELMDRAYRALNHPRTLSQYELSPQWRGVAAPVAKVAFWTPLAIAGTGALALLVVVYIILRVILAGTGAPAMAALGAINPHEPLRLSRAAQVKAPPSDAQAERIRTFLAPEIEQGLVKVIEDSTTVRVQTTASGGQLFKSGSDQLAPARLGLFNRIALALNTEAGPVKVEGYTDTDKPRGDVAFPDNIALSQARAQSVASIIRAGLQDQGRVTAVGFGDTQPIASNDTPDGKAQNRRVEVVVERRN